MIAIRAKWVLATEDERQSLLRDKYVLVEGNRIVGFDRSPPSGAELLEPMAGLVTPGLINLHAHSLNAPLFRGLVDDLPAFRRPEEMIYRLLMPVGQIAMDVLDDRELSALIESGLEEMLATGTTTVVDMWRPEQQSVFFAVAESLGIRAYGAPYIRSRAILGMTPEGRPEYGPDESDNTLDAALQVFDRYDGVAGGRLRVALGPHATDTCSAALLAKVAEGALERNALVTAHVAQSRAECEEVERRDGVSPMRLLHRAGLARAKTLAAHCTFAAESDLEALASSGLSVAHCPLTYARLGVTVTADRFWQAGIPVGLGTDAYCMDMLSEMRAAGYFSKLQTGRSDSATAWSLLDTATRVAADALGRPDLGRIERGKTADLAIFDLRGVRVDPVIDPIKTLVWYGTSQNLFGVVVDGRVVSRAARVGNAASDRASVCAGAVSKVVQTAREGGFLT